MHRTDLAPGGQPLVQFDLRGIREATRSLTMNPQICLHAEHKSILNFSPFYIFALSIIFFICPLKILYVYGQQGGEGIHGDEWGENGGMVTIM